MADQEKTLVSVLASGRGDAPPIQLMKPRSGEPDDGMVVVLMAMFT